MGTGYFSSEIKRQGDPGALGCAPTWRSRVQAELQVSNGRLHLLSWAPLRPWEMYVRSGREGERGQAGLGPHHEGPLQLAWPKTLSSGKILL